MTVSFSICSSSLGEALPFLSDVDLLLVNYVDIESRRRAAPASFDKELSTKAHSRTPARR